MSDRLPGPRLPWGVLLLVLVILLGRGAWVLWSTSQIDDSNLQQANLTLPIYGKVPEFSLVNQQGLPITNNHLAGSVWITDFFFTRCSGQCLFLTKQMYELQESLPQSILLTSFSVDPEWDTIDRLKSYAERMGAKDKRWNFLTGDVENIYQISREGFHLGVEPDAGNREEPIIHSKRLILLDKEGQIRGYYDSTDDAAVKQLKADALALLNASS